MMAVAKLFGVEQKRKEDPRLITGQGTFTEDIQLANTAYAAFVRSPLAHATITNIDTEAAIDAPGVIQVYTGKCLEDKIAPVPTAWLIPDSDLKTPAHPAIAIDRVRYVGDAVAVVIAETMEQARDAAALIDVDYDELPVVVNMNDAVSGGQLVHDDVENNTGFTWAIKNGDIDAAFNDADKVVPLSMNNHRLIPAAMETRNTIAQYNSGTGELTLYTTSQNPHIHRFLVSVVCGLPEHLVRVISSEIGGGFGSKIPCYPEEVVVSFLAKDVGRPIKWSETRTENFQATIHGRDHLVDLEVAVKNDGTLLGIRGNCMANLGAYLSTASPGVPTILHGLMMVGPYTFSAIDYTVKGVFTNTTPTDAYRGAGRPEATYYVERMVDVVAAELGIDPIEIRRKNLVKSDQFPYECATTLIYDSGNYHEALDKALETFDLAAFRKEQAEARAEGRYLGVGFCTYVEICGLGPSQVAGAVGFQGGLWESSIVRLHPTGKVSVMIGANPHGQGEQTTFAQVVADELGVGLEDVDIIHGDTARTPMGWGTYGSRTTPVAGAATAVACRKVIDKAKTIAAHMFEASVEDIEFNGGDFFVKGSPDNVKTIQDVCLQAHLAWDLPEGTDPGLEESAFYDPPNFVYPFGTHICVVEIDPETGVTKPIRYVCVDDCGPVINPLIVRGQVHGGITQGLAQAFYEAAIYDENGQLLTGSMVDYAIPKAEQLPAYETDHTVTPSPHHPLGVKGVGETGTIASAAAAANAVMDALSHLGIRHLDMPYTPARVWEAIQNANQD